MYGEKLSVAGFFGSIPDIVSDDGDHQYTIDKAKAYADYPDTRAIALQDRFGGSIRDDVKMVDQPPTPIRSPHPIWPIVKHATASTASRT